MTKDKLNRVQYVANSLYKLEKIIAGMENGERITIRTATTAWTTPKTEKEHDALYELLKAEYLRLRDEFYNA